jgi:SSS family solute:Na+ symporter
MLRAKNVVGLLRPDATGEQHVVLAKCLVPVLMLIAVYFTLTGSATIVALLLLGYSYVTQLFPSVIASLMARNHATAAGAFAGILTGVVITTILTFTKTTIGSLFPALPEVIRDLNVGIIALIGNVVVMVVVSTLTRSRVQAPRTA